jgi:hypothetical protein
MVRMYVEGRPQAVCQRSPGQHTRSSAVQTQEVTTLARYERTGKRSYANCVSFLYTTRSRCHRLPWGNLPSAAAR